MDQSKTEALKAKTWGEIAVDAAKNPWVEGAVGLVAAGAVIASRGKLYSAAEKFLPKAFSLSGEASEGALPAVEKIGANPLAAQIAADSGKALVPAKAFVPPNGVPGRGDSAVHNWLIGDASAGKAASTISGAGEKMGVLGAIPKTALPLDIEAVHVAASGAARSALDLDDGKKILGLFPRVSALGPQVPHIVHIPEQTVVERETAEQAALLAVHAAHPLPTEWPMGMMETADVPQWPITGHAPGYDDLRWLSGIGSSEIGTSGSAAAERSLGDLLRQLRADSLTGAAEDAVPVGEKIGGKALNASVADSPKVLEPSDIWTPSRIPLEGALGPKGPHVVFIPTATVEAVEGLGLGATGGPDFAKLAGKGLAPGTDIEAIKPPTGTSAAMLGGRLGIESAVGVKAKTPSFYYLDEKKVPGT